jgi:hypothetical protein
MKKSRTIVLAAGMLLIAATPVFAQAAIQELACSRSIIPIGTF